MTSLGDKSVTQLLLRHESWQSFLCNDISKAGGIGAQLDSIRDAIAAVIDACDRGTQQEQDEALDALEGLLDGEEK